MPEEILVKSVLNKSKQRDSWFLNDYTVNAYSGCSFNCLYCYIRGSKYGLNMTEKLRIKINAPDVLEKQLKSRAKRGDYGIVVVSSATDPYLQLEKKYELTRKMLLLLLRYKFPVHVITKSDLMLRDLDLLHQINEAAILPAELQPTLKHKVIVSFSFSTIDNDISALFEPGATPPSRRLEALAQTLRSGLHTGVTMMPLLPYLTDTSEYMERMFSTFNDHHVCYVMPASITLFGTNSSDSKPLMLGAIEQHYPDLLPEYQKLFSFGTQVPRWYNNMVMKRAALLQAKYGLKNSIA